MEVRRARDHSWRIQGLPGGRGEQGGEGWSAAAQWSHPASTWCWPWDFHILGGPGGLRGCW